MIHTTESKERPGIAERIAAWSADGHGGRQASAHFYVDNKNIVQSVEPNNIAWHAAGDNLHTIGIELCGYAHQNAVEWADAYSQMLGLDPTIILPTEQGARVRRAIAVRWAVEIVAIAVSRGGLASRVCVSYA